MKVTIWIGAAALAALFAAGCDSDRALGTEKNHDTPVGPMPPAAPYQDPALNPYKGVDITPPAMEPKAEREKPSQAKELPEGKTQEPFDNSNAKLQVIEVQNGEDLASIPDLNEPIWAP
jgi:hypothetical protein